MKRQREREARKKSEREEGTDGQRYIRATKREREMALRIKGEEVKMSTKRMGERERGRKRGERVGGRQTDRQ